MTRERECICHVCFTRRTWNMTGICDGCAFPSYRDPECPVESLSHRCYRDDGKTLAGPDDGPCWVNARRSLKAVA